MRILPGLIVPLLLVEACGSGPRGGSSPTPTRGSVVVVAYLDENRNGVLDEAEGIRIPGVEISLGGASGRTSATTGSFSADVMRSPQTLLVNPSSLPPFHRAPDPTVVNPSAAGFVNVPITLPLGEGAVAGVFLAFGDSITNGQAGAGDGQGYAGELERKLAAHFGRARVINDGVDSSSSERGDERIEASLAGGRPAFTLVLYGTNDWADPRCAQNPCFTVSRLRSMVSKVKARGGHAFVATLLMTNLGADFRASPQRNSWIEGQNELIRVMAREEGAVLVDLHAAFERAGVPLSTLFADYIHPSAEGYRLMAQAWFEAITVPR